jgi:hypothetical protein
MIVLSVRQDAARKHSTDDPGWIQGLRGDHCRIQRMCIISSVTDALGARSVRDSVRIVHTEEAISAAAVVVQLIGRVTEVLLIFKDGDVLRLTCRR